MIAYCKAISGKDNMKRRNMRMNRKVLPLGRASMLGQRQRVILRNQVRSVVLRASGSFHSRITKIICFEVSI